MARKGKAERRDPRKGRALSVAFLTLILGLSLLPRAGGAIPLLLARWQRFLAGEGAAVVVMALLLLAVFLWQGRRLGARVGGLLLVTLGSLGLLHGIRGGDPYSCLLYTSDAADE